MLDQLPSIAPLFIASFSRITQTTNTWPSGRDKMTVWKEVACREYIPNDPFATRIVGTMIGLAGGFQSIGQMQLLGGTLK